MGLPVLFTVLLAVQVMGLFPVRAGAEEGDAMLAESGIRYPDGFDSNTVGDVRGKVHDLVQPEKGPVRFLLTSERETYTVLASPVWYWNDLGAKVPEGADVVVRGSKSLGKDGKLYVIAQEIETKSDGRDMIFRGEDGSPLWRGAGMGRGRGRGNSGASQGAGQGAGAGGGAGGGGGRGRGGR